MIQNNSELSNTELNCFWKHNSVIVLCDCIIMALIGENYDLCHWNVTGYTIITFTQNILILFAYLPYISVQDVFCCFTISIINLLMMLYLPQTVLPCISKLSKQWSLVISAKHNSTCNIIGTFGIHIPHCMFLIKTLQYNYIECPQKIV